MALNGLDDEICVRFTGGGGGGGEGGGEGCGEGCGGVLRQALVGGERVAACMCNPPFYGEEEAPRGRADRAGERCEGSPLRERRC